MVPISGAGVGLRREFLPHVFEGGLQPDWFEITPENWFFMPAFFRSDFEWVAGAFSLAAHGLGLSVGSPDRLDRRYLKRLKAFLDRYEVRVYSEHLSFSSFHGVQSYELLPLPMTRKMVRHVVDRVDEAQNLLGRQIALENATWYASPLAQMPESEFINEVLHHSGASLLLDVNNVYVNAFNHDFDATGFIDALELDRVAYYHVAGHLEYRPDLWVDTHGMPTKEAVWQLLEYAYAKAPAPILLERDNNVPTRLDDLQGEYDQIRRIMGSQRVVAN